MSAAPLRWRGGLPVTVIGGYLGSGKTTLVNHLLRHAGGRRLCVLVNDFGSVPIDRDLIVSGDGDTVEISGGCVCCSYGSDLMETLGGLRARLPAVEHVLLEASGVALPGAVASSVSLLPSLRLDGIVVMADAETVRPRSEDQFLGDTILRQLAAADLVILNRGDLVGGETTNETSRWLETRAPGAKVVTAAHGAVDPALVLGLREGAGTVDAGLPVPDAAQLYASVDLLLPLTVDIDALAQRLTAPMLGILRAKAIVETGRGPVALHVVGGRSAIDAAPASARTGRLVAIGLRGRLNPAAIASAISA